MRSIRKHGLFADGRSLPYLIGCRTCSGHEIATFFFFLKKTHIGCYEL